jgi:rSAM/selenodomain-associated transferase 2
VKLSVVIPALDEAGHIEAAIRSARPEPILEPNSEPIAGSIPPVEFLSGSSAGRKFEPSDLSASGVEIIVVDGGSRDDTAERAAAAGAHVVHGERGRARQLRDGMGAAAGEVVLMLHADTRLPAGWDDGVRAALADPAVVGGAFRLRFDERSPGLALIEWGARLRSALWRLPYGDQALFVRRDALDAIGGVPQVPVMEDVDLVQALKRRGRIALLPLSVLTSARRYREGGAFRTVVRHFFAVVARVLGVDRARLAEWMGR